MLLPTPWTSTLADKSTYCSLAIFCFGKHLFIIYNMYTYSCTGYSATLTKVSGINRLVPIMVLINSLQKYNPGWNLCIFTCTYLCKMNLPFLTLSEIFPRHKVTGVNGVIKVKGIVPPETCHTDSKQTVNTHCLTKTKTPYDINQFLHLWFKKILCCERGMGLKYCSLDHVTVLSVPGAVQS